MLRSTGVGVFHSPFHFLYCQTYRGGLSIYRKFRVKISTRSAYLFGASIIRGAFGRHIGNFRRTFIFHCVALLSVYSLPGICSGGSFSNRPVGFVFRNRGTYQQRTPPLLPLLLVRRTPPVFCILSRRVGLSLVRLGAMYTPGDRNRLSPVPGRLPFFPVIGWLSRMRLTH